MARKEGHCSYCGEPLVVGDPYEGGVMSNGYHYYCWKEWQAEMRADAEEYYEPPEEE